MSTDPVLRHLTWKQMEQLDELCDVEPEPRVVTWHHSRIGSQGPVVEFSDGRRAWVGPTGRITGLS